MQFVFRIAVSFLVAIFCYVVLNVLLVRRWMSLYFGQSWRSHHGTTMSTPVASTFWISYVTWFWTKLAGCAWRQRVRRLPVLYQQVPQQGRLLLCRCCPPLRTKTEWDRVPLVRFSTVRLQWTAALLINSDVAINITISETCCLLQ